MNTLIFRGNPVKKIKYMENGSRRVDPSGLTHSIDQCALNFTKSTMRRRDKSFDRR